MAGISASINVKLALGDDLYTVDVNLPSTAPTADAPFHFNVISSPSAKPDEKDTLLDVAIGAANQVYVAVMPPNSLLVTAGVADVVKELQVVVAEGNYDPKTGKFS